MLDTIHIFHQNYAMNKNNTYPVQNPTPEDFKSISNMLDAIFRSEGGSMTTEFPALLAPSNASNIRVIKEDGQVVAHAAINLCSLSLQGVVLPIAQLGAVAVSPASRGKGYATKIVRSLMEHAVSGGACAMWISGNLELYKKLGAQEFGAHNSFIIKKELATKLHNANLTISPLGIKNIPSLTTIYAQEPNRFIRPREDWEHALNLERTEDSPSQFLGITRANKLIAYLVLHVNESAKSARVTEHAGEPSAILGACLSVMQETKTNSVQINLDRQERGITSTLTGLGVSPTCKHNSGTMLILDFPALMQTLRPRIAERLGMRAAEKFAYNREGDKFVLDCCDEKLEISSLASLTECIFGAPEQIPPAPFDKFLPLPTIRYGLNFV